MRNDFSRERRRWDSISSRRSDRDLSVYHEGHFFLMDDVKPQPRRVEKREVLTTATTGKAVRRGEKRRRKAERENEQRLQQVREEELGWGGW